MFITAIQVQAKNPDRVNVSVDGRYRLSLDVFQVGDLGIKVGKKVTQEQLSSWEEESTYGKLYSRALEYTLMRPHSAQEIREYLRKKTFDKRYRGKSGDIKTREGVSQSIADRVFERLDEKGYINDEAFARFWVENRHVRKGISQRKLIMELRAKGVSVQAIDDAMQNRTRDEKSELRKIIEKKRHTYSDEQKLIAYLARQGFSYQDIRDELNSNSD